MPGKQYTVVRSFRRVDQSTGDDSFFEKDAIYSGPVGKFDLDPAGPDGKGPLLAEKQAAPASSDSTSKEKS